MLNQDFREFIELLHSHNVRYLVIGGYAVAIHGHPRSTKDIDIWVDCSPDNAEQIMAALRAFGFGSLGLSADDFSEPRQIIQLGSVPNRIDILTSAVGVEFEEAFEARLDAMIGDTLVHVIDKQSLIRNKLAAGRPQDLADVDHLR